MNSLKRIICALVTAAAALGSSQAHSLDSAAARISRPVVQSAPPAGPDDFKDALSIVLNRMMASYATKVKQPLRIDVLDTSHDSVARFFSGISGGAFDPHTILAVNFDARAKINGQRTAACLVQYNSGRRQDLLSGYETSRIFNKQEILYFIAAHEFGHCMAFHQEDMGHRLGLSNKDHELLADKVAVTFFMVNGRAESAQRVVDFNRKLVGDELHSHPEKLQDYHDRLSRFMQGKNARELVSSMYDVYRIATGAIKLDY